MPGPSFARKCVALGLGLAVGMLLLGPRAARAQYGVVLSAAGPVDRSMAGTGTATALDASGALYWNPAAITGLDSNQADVGLEAWYGHNKVSSAIPTGAITPGSPAVGKVPAVAPVPPSLLTATDRSDNGVYLFPTLGVVWQPDGMPLIYGLGAYTVGSLGVNFTVDPKNPILNVQPTKGAPTFGQGPLFSHMEFYEIAPTIAFRVTEQLSIGIAPTLALASISITPTQFGAPDANGAYPPATNGRLCAGGGGQFGIWYNSDWDWNFGASVKSPQQFQTFRYNTFSGKNPTSTQFQFDYPGIASLGASYTGLDKWVLAADFRYIDYRNATGFDGSGFYPIGPQAGSLRGLGWNDVFVAALGAQYEIANGWFVRGGYSYNTDPVPTTRISFNAATPGILENTVYVGASYDVTDTFRVSIAYAHAFDSSVRGPLNTFGSGIVQNSTVESTSSADTVILGATFRF
jgi:long-chain fatty acid transport protein